MIQSDVVDLAKALRTFFSASSHAYIQETLLLWPETDAVSATLPASSSLPVLSFLDVASQNAPADSKPLADAVKNAAPALCWGQTYSKSDLGDAFLNRYGWTSVVGPNAPIKNQHLISGFLFLGPDIEYPYHKHSVEEVYKVVSGTASWRLGEDDWTPLPPGSVVHNTPWRAHGMRTNHGEPLLLAFLWRSGAVEKSVMV